MGESPTQTGAIGTRSRFGRPVLLFVVIAALHGLGTELAYTVNRVTSEGVSLFPAAGVTVAALLLVSRRRWPIVLAATLVAELTGNFLIGEVAATAIGSAVSNVVEPLVGAWVVLRLLGRPPALSLRRDLFAFLAGACVIGPTAGAILGAASTRFTPGHLSYLSVLGRWFTGDALGVLVVGSLILAWIVPSPAPPRSEPLLLEALVVGALIVTLTAAPFWSWSPALAYLALPPLVWAAMRFGVRGATLGGATVALIGDWATIQGHGVFALLAGSRHDMALWQLQLFLGVLLITTLVLSSQVTEPGEAEKALQESAARHRFASLLESSPDPILLFRADSTVEYVNEQVLALTHLSRDELVGRPFVDLVSERRRGEVLEALATVDREPAGSRLSFDMEGFGDVLNGAFEAAISPLDTADGRMLVATLRDVTERRETNRQLRRALSSAEHATKAKADFLATMSHEIRTPMSAVSSLIDLLGTTDLDDDQRELVATMKSSSVALLRIIDDTLDFSKIEAGMLELESVPFSIADELRGLASLFDPSATMKGITLEWRVDPAVPASLLGDPVRVRQILLNLVGNALKFTDHGGVDVDAAPVESDTDAVVVEFRVRDTGVGIDPAQQATLFQAFTQAEHATTRLYGGTGLGLSIVSRLVDMMDGSIELDSAPQRGSTFAVRLPFAVDPEASTSRRPPEGVAADLEHRSFGGHVVLVAEDNDVNRDVMRRQLALLGCACAAASNGRSALERYRSGGISLVLTDCHMPDMDGFQLTHAIRSTEDADGPHVAIVAVTAKAMQGERERCLAAGMNAYLTKPVDLKDLAATLSRLLPPEPVVGPNSVDLTALREIVGGDEEALSEVLLVYADTMRALLDDLDTCHAAGDGKGVASVAHRVSGAAMSVGAERLATFARAAELGVAGDPEALRSTIEWIHIEADAVDDQIAVIGRVHG